MGGHESLRPVERRVLRLVAVASIASRSLDVSGADQSSLIG